MAPRPHARTSITAVAAALALLAAACSPQPAQEAPAAAAPQPAQETAPAAAPEHLSACEDPAAEGLGDGMYMLDGLRYEVAGESCVARPRNPEAAETTVAEPDDAASIEDAEPATETSTKGDPEQVCVDGVCADAPEDGGPAELPQVELPPGFANHEHPPETEPGHDPESDTAPEPDPQPATTTSAPEPDTAPEPDPEPATTTSPPEPGAEPEPATTTTPEPEPTTSTTVPDPEPPTSTTVAPEPEPPTTTAPLPEQVGDPVVMAFTNDADCRYYQGCSQPIDLRVGTVLLWPDSSRFPDDPATVVAIEDIELVGSGRPPNWATVRVCWLQEPYGHLLHRWTAQKDAEGVYRIELNLGDQHGPC